VIEFSFSAPTPTTADLIDLIGTIRERVALVDLGVPAGDDLDRLVNDYMDKMQAVDQQLEELFDLQDEVIAPLMARSRAEIDLEEGLRAYGLLEHAEAMQMPCEEAVQLLANV
jgi:hypothetical protein